MTKKQINAVNKTAEYVGKSIDAFSCICEDSTIKKSGINGEPFNCEGCCLVAYSRTLMFDCPLRYIKSASHTLADIKNAVDQGEL